MHPSQYLTVMLLNDVVVHDDVTLVAESEGTLMEIIGDAYFVEFAIEDGTLVGNHRYELITLAAEEFAVIEGIAEKSE